jgi:hypothetical protein
MKLILLRKLLAAGNYYSKPCSCSNLLSSIFSCFCFVCFIWFKKIHMFDLSVLGDPTVTMMFVRFSFFDKSCDGLTYFQGFLPVYGFMCPKLFSGVVIHKVGYPLYL